MEINNYTKTKNFEIKFSTLLSFYNEKKLDMVLSYGKNLLKNFPNNEFILNTIGIALYESNKIYDAKKFFKIAIKNNRNFFEAYNNLGILYENLGENHKAKKFFKKALLINPKYIDAHSNLGLLEKKINNYEKALRSFENAYNLDKNNETVVHYLSDVLILLSKQETVIKLLKNFVIDNPQSFLSYHLLGQVYEDLDIELAIKNYKKALLLNEHFLPSLCNIGKIYSDNEKNDIASLFFKNGFKSVQKFNYNLQGCLNFCLYAGMFFFRVKEINKAYQCFNMALKVDSNSEAAQIEKFHMMREMCNWSEFENAKYFFTSIDHKNTLIQPYSFLIQYDDPLKQKLISEHYSLKNFNNKRSDLNHLFKEDSKKIRIGYFSADFIDHPVSKLLSRMIKLHDRNRFEIFCYSFKSNDNCEIQKHFKYYSDYFINTENLSNQEIVHLVQKDKIHIAIDLMGYTRGSKAEIFSFGLAPIQINYLGYSSTTGSNFIDYIIGDEITIPKENENFFTEKIIRLPNSFMPTYDNDKISDKKISRTDMGLPEIGIVFCSFNQCKKICPNVFNIWMEILLEIKESVLWLSTPNEWAKENLRKVAKEKNVNPSRLIFADRVLIDEHYKRHQLADLFLDTFDYNSHATAVDCLWSGLPLITKIGKGFQARIASSLLNALGMNELITKSEKEYKELILKLAQDLSKIRSLKDKLNKNLKNYPLFNSIKYTRNFEKALKDVYDDKLRLFRD